LPATASWFSAWRIRCSICQRSTADSPRSIASSSAFAASSCSRARASSISAAETASSTSAIARSWSTWKNPGPVANSSTSPPGGCTRVEPAFSVAMSGAWRARTPISPAAPGTMIISASPSYAGPSGVTTETEKTRRSAIGSGGGAGHLLRALDGALDRPDHVERLLRQLVVLALDDLAEPADRVLELHVLAGRAGELLRDEVRLREEPLDLPRPGDRQPVLVRELLDAQDRDDVLQVLVALQDLLHARRDRVVLLGDDARLQRAGGRVERVDGRVDPLLHDRAAQHCRRVAVRERVRGRRVGEVVSGDVDRLHRSDGALRRRGDPLLELTHLRRERRLVADGARHAAEQRRDLGARLDEPEDVVDEEEHVLALVAEVLRHRQAGQADAQARSGRFVHLPVAEGDLVDHLRLRHLEQQVVPLTRALADAREDGNAAVLARDVGDQLLDQHRLPDAGAAEETDLPAAGVRGDQVDHLDPGLEDLDLRRQVLERGRVAVDRPARGVRGRRRLVVDGIAEDVPDTAERDVPDRDADRRAGVDDVGPAGDAVRRVHRDRAHAIVAEVLLHLRDQRAAARPRDRERRVDRGELVREDGVD